jgi:hypothetical protein
MKSTLGFEQNDQEMVRQLENRLQPGTNNANAAGLFNTENDDDALKAALQMRIDESKETAKFIRETLSKINNVGFA